MSPRFPIEIKSVLIELSNGLAPEPMLTSIDSDNGMSPI